MITLPSCDMRSPAPIPKKTSDTAKAVPFRVTSIVPTSTSAALLPRQEAAEDDKAADDQERYEGEPERCDLVPVDRRRVDRSDPAPGAALQDPEHDQAEGDGGERCPAVVQLWRVLGLGRPL